jgi:hypothetical protein
VEPRQQGSFAHRHQQYVQHRRAWLRCPWCRGQPRRCGAGSLQSRPQHLPRPLALHAPAVAPVSHIRVWQRRRARARAAGCAGVQVQAQLVVQGGRCKRSWLCRGGGASAAGCASKQAQGQRCVQVRQGFARAVVCSDCHIAGAAVPHGKCTHHIGARLQVQQQRCGVQRSGGPKPRLQRSLQKLAGHLPFRDTPTCQAADHGLRASIATPVPQCPSGAPVLCYQAVRGGGGGGKNPHATTVLACARMPVECEPLQDVVTAVRVHTSRRPATQMRAMPATRVCWSDALAPAGMICQPTMTRGLLCTASTRAREQRLQHSLIPVRCVGRISRKVSLLQSFVTVNKNLTPCTSSTPEQCLRHSLGWPCGRQQQRLLPGSRCNALS